jgi:hypothetical protein
MGPAEESAAVVASSCRGRRRCASRGTRVPLVPGREKGRDALHCRFCEAGKVSESQGVAVHQALEEDRAGPLSP